jgi:AraC-like DNA-binding protein/uncharacterized damage-inducible protein DinB
MADDERRADPLRRYLDILIETLDEGLRGEQVAERAYLSRYHFDRMVRAAALEPPGAIRRRLLLERAAFALTRSDAPIADIANDAGYVSPTAFARAFGRAFGVSPSTHRCTRPPGFWLESPNGVHFHPPGGVLLPRASEGRSELNLTDRLVEHDLWLTERLIRSAADLSDEQLDGPAEPGGANIPEISSPTLRELLGYLVFSKEVWAASIGGRSRPDDGDTTIPGMLERLEKIRPEYRRLVADISANGTWDTAFVHTLWDPPETFTFGGAIAHVITFSAYRRELVIGALRRLGVEGLGYGDPIEWERAMLFKDA